MVCRKLCRLHQRFVRGCNTARLNYSMRTVNILCVQPYIVALCYAQGKGIV